MKNMIFGLWWFLLPVFGQIQMDEGWQALVETNQFEDARGHFAKLPDDELARIGWFLSYTGAGPGTALGEAAMTVLRQAPHSGSAEFVLKWMDPFETCLDNWMEEAGGILDAAQPANPELKVLQAEYNRGRALLREETPQFSQIARDGGFLTAWKISSRYGAFPVPAFERGWPPDRPQGWQDAILHETRTGVVVPPREALGAGVVYAFSEFENPVDQEVQLRLFSYQNVAVFVNGEAWGRFLHLQEFSPNIRYLRGFLPAGRHEVVIKTSQTRGNDGQFSLQVTAAQQPTFVEPRMPSHELKPGKTRHADLKVGLEASLEGRHHPLADLVRAVLAMHHKDDQTALGLLEPLQQQYPGSQVIGGLLARIYLGRVKYLPQEEQLGRAFQILQNLSAASHSYNLENKMSLALLLHKVNQSRQALDLLNGILAANPGYCDALEARLLLARDQALHDVRQQTTGLLEAMGPDHRWAQKLLLEEAREEGNLDLTRSLLENLGRLLPWEGYGAQLHEMNEDFATAIADLKKREAVYTNRDDYPYAIAKACAKLGDRPAQREWLEKTLSINPAHRDAILDLVNLDSFEGRRKQAMARINEYLAIEPADAHFRQRLSHLEGATAFETFRVDTAKVIASAKNKPISKGADSELLLDQLMVRLFPDGSQMRYTHLVTRVLTKEGVDQESELNLPRDLEILELRTIKADGSVYYPENIANKSTISLSGIGVGDFIDEEHIEYLPPAYYDRDGLDANMTFIFQGVDRIYHHSELVLIYPEGLFPEPVLLARNMPVEPQIEVKDGLTYVRWLTQDMPPLEVEPGMPPRGYFQPTASFYYNTTWDEIRDFYYNAVRLRMGLSARLREKLTTWREQAPEPRKRAALIYEEVTDRTEPEGQFYKNVNLTWETQSGNPTLLLAAIYNEMGWDADILLVRPEQTKHYLFDTPMPNFSYALIRLRLEGETFWLDANQKGLAFGYVPFPYRRSEGLALDPREPLNDTVPAFSDESEIVDSRYNLYLREDGSVQGLGSEKFSGLFAAQLAEKYAQLNKPETKQRIEAGINQTFPGAVVSEVTIIEDLPQGAFELTNVFHHPKLAPFEDGVLQLPFLLPKTPLLDRYGGLPSRKTPVHISQPHYNRTTLNLFLPEGYRWRTEAAKVKKSSRFGSYDLDISIVNKRELSITRTYRLRAQFVLPEIYEDFLVFCKAMVDNEDITYQAVKDAGLP